MGETGTFRNGDGGRLAFTPTDAEFRDALVHTSGNQLRARTPTDPDATFLVVYLTVENTGSEGIDLPTRPSVVVDGRQYDMEFESVSGTTGYDAFNELSAGSSMDYVSVFEVPPSDATGQLVVNFLSYGESTTKKWRLDLSELDRSTFDFTGLEPGSDAELGTSDTGYRLTVEGTSRRDTYQYTTHDGQQQEVEAADGNTFLFVSLAAENTGQTPVYVPDRYDMRLLADSTQYEPENRLPDENAYDGGELAPGVVSSGVVPFEVPTDASGFEFRLSLAGDIPASWDL